MIPGLEPLFRIYYNSDHQYNACGLPRVPLAEPKTATLITTTVYIYDSFLLSYKPIPLITNSKQLYQTYTDIFRHYYNIFRHGHTYSFNLILAPEDQYQNNTRIELESP